MPRKRERGQGGLLKLQNCRFWYAQWYDADGRQHRVSTKTEVKQEAEAALRRMMGDNERGLMPVSELRKVRYEDLRAGLIQNYTEKGNKSLLTRADGSEFINGIEALDKFFAGAPLTRLTTDAAREFARKRLKDGVTNSTVNNSLALLRRMLHIAHEDGKLPVVPKIRLLKANPARKGFLPREKFEELLAALPKHLRPLVMLLYFCGVRLGEALQVEWKQVDLTRPIIRLESEQTKTSEPRIIPLPDVLVRMLRQAEPKEGRVFDGTNIRKEWAKACAAVGLGTLGPVDGNGDRRYSGLLIHDLRRSAIKNLMRMGVSEKVAMTISGHKTRAVFDRYNIIDEQDVLDAMQRVSHGVSLVKSAPAGRRIKA